MSYIKFEQLQENLLKFDLHIETNKQISCLKRIKSGGDLLIIDSNKKSILTALLVGIVEKIQTPADDDAPRILIVAPNREACLEIEDLWVKISKRTEMIHTMTYEEGDKVKQRLSLFNGADLVIGSPKRVNELYFQNGINVNHLKYFLVIDSEMCIKNSSILHIARMCDSFPKCQRIIYNNGLLKYTERLVGSILTNPMILEEI